MKLNFNNAAKLLLLAAAMAAASTASAQSAGQWTLKAGVNKITPKVDSGDVSAPALPGTKAAIGSDTEPLFAFGYGLTDNISMELDLGLPYKHTLYGAGSVEGTGKLGTVESLPPTLFVQYRFFDPAAKVRPYLGLGATYAYFQKAKGSGQMTAITNIGGPATTFKVDNKLAGSVQAGVTVALNERWFLDLAVVKTYLKTTVRFSTGQTQEMTLDPVAVGVNVGYRF
ncbi:outer membrane protein [Oxalobacteraceae bacterium GrIS 1.11]